MELGSSPLRSSPPSSLPRPEISPPSSPIPPDSPPRKRRSWQVYSENSHLSKSKEWRWNNLDLGDVIEHEESEEEQYQGPEGLDNIIPDNEESQGTYEEPQYHDSDERDGRSSGLSVNGDSKDSISQDSSDSRDPISSSSDTSDFQDSHDSSSDSETDSGKENLSDSHNSSSSSEVSCDDDDEDSDDYVAPLYKGSEYSVDEAVFDVLSDYINNHETKKSLRCHLKTFLKHIPKPNNMPKTTEQLLSKVERLVPEYKETACFYCSKCFAFLEIPGPCYVCGCQDRSKFYVCCIQDQLKCYLEQFNLADVIDKYSKSRPNDEKIIRDILDGSEYRRVKPVDEFSLTLMMNTDGVSISKSSKTVIWPVMYVICEVPPHLRRRFMIVSGIWCDSQEPPMNCFLRPFAEMLEKIEDDGGVLWTHPNTKVQQRSRVYVPLICADAPARAKIQNLVSHNGKQSCNTCEQRSVKLPLTVEEQTAKAAGNKKIRRRRGYTFRDIPAALRTQSRMEKQAAHAVQINKNRIKKKNVKGVKGPSIVSFIPKIDLSKCCYAEYMHGLCLGAVKTFLTLWLTIPGDWNISAYKPEIDSFLNSIAPSDDIGRLPRGVSDMKHWKASEFRSWLLFYSLPCIVGKLGDKYVQHWCLLVISTFVLLQEEISECDLKSTGIMLRIFLRDIGNLYRHKDYVFNVHQVLHLPLYVERFGPLWSNSAFLFEGYNSNIVGLIHGTKNRGKELMTNVRVAHGIEIVKSKLQDRNFVEVDKKKNFEALNVCKNVALSEEDKVLLVSKNIKVSTNAISSRVRIGREIFTSMLYKRQRKRNNFCIKYESLSASSYGSIKYFVQDNNECFAVVRRLLVDHTRRFCHNASGAKVKHIIPVENNAENCCAVVNVKDILMKMIKVGDYVCFSPNSHEKNL